MRHRPLPSYWEPETTGFCNLPYGVFAQDSFKWKPNFTINIGLRYEWNSTPSEAMGRFTNFDLTTGTLIPANQPFHTNNKNFEPRIGFAWDPFKDGKTSVRAAYAILTQDPTTNIVSPLSGNPLFAVPVSVNSATNSITLENPSASITGLGLGPNAVDPGFDNMYSQDWNLTSSSAQLTSTMGLEVAYVGMKATHLQMTGNFNQPFVTNGFYDPTRPYITLCRSPALFCRRNAPRPTRRVPSGTSPESSVPGIPITTHSGSRSTNISPTASSF